MAYYAIFTTLGLQRLAEAAATYTPLEFTEMAVGDGDGSPTTPSASQTELVNETARVSVNLVEVDPDNPNQVRVEGLFPAATGGFVIREAGIFNADNELIAVANYPDIAKPELADGASIEEYIRILLVYENPTDAIELTADLSVVMATRQYVDTQDAALQALLEAEIAALATETKKRWLGTEHASLPSADWTLSDGAAGNYRVFTYDGSGATVLYFTVPLQYGTDRYEKLTTAALKIYKDGTGTTTVHVYKMAGMDTTGVPALTSLGNSTSSTAGHQLISVGSLTAQAKDDEMLLVAVSGGDANDKVYGVRVTTVWTEV